MRFFKGIWILSAGGNNMERSLHSMERDSSYYDFSMTRKPKEYGKDLQERIESGSPLR